MNDLYNLKSNIQDLNKLYSALCYELNKTLIVDKHTVDYELLSSLNCNSVSNISEIDHIIRAIKKRKEEEN